MPVDDTSVFSFSPTCWVLAILARLGNVGVVNVKPGRPSRWRATSQHADGPVAESSHSRTRTNRRNFIFGLGLFAEQIVGAFANTGFLDQRRSQRLQEARSHEYRNRIIKKR